jgi:hypothetical protein
VSALTNARGVREKEGAGTMSDEAIKQHSKENNSEKHANRADANAGNFLREEFLSSASSGTTRSSDGSMSSVHAVQLGGSADRLDGSSGDASVSRSDGGRNGIWTTYGPDGQPTSDCHGPLPRGGGKGGYGLPGLEIDHGTDKNPAVGIVSPRDKYPPIDKFPSIDFPPIDKTPAGKGTEQFPPVPSLDSIAPIMLPEFFEKYPKSPELDRVGESADKLAKLIKENASPEEQRKAWDEFEKNGKEVPANLAALRLQESFYLQKNASGLTVEVNNYNGKLSVVDYGRYGTLDKFEYKEPNLKFFDPTAEKQPEVVKAAADFAERIQKGITSEELKQLVPELLGRLARAGLDSLQASCAIDWALDHAPNNKYSNPGDRGPVFVVDGKPVHIWTSATIGGGPVNFNYSPEGKKLFG